MDKIITDPQERMAEFNKIDTKSLETYYRILHMTKNCLSSQQIRDWNYQDMDMVGRILQGRKVPS